MLNSVKTFALLGWILAGLTSLGIAAEMLHPQQEKPTAPASGQRKTEFLAAARGRIDIEGGVIRLAAQRDGVISAALVEEGERVKAGQLLATLDDSLARRNVELAASELRQIRQQFERAKIETVAARRELRRVSPLAGKDDVPRQELDRAADSAKLAEAGQSAAEAAVDAAQARLRIAEREVEERRVVAPLDGVVIQRQARPGNGVSTLNVTPLFLFAPDVPRIVRAELEEQYIPLVAPGRRATIILEADPRITTTGEVLRLGRMVGQRTPSEDPAEKQDNRVIEVVLSVEAQDLLIGQRVIVRFQDS